MIDWGEITTISGAIAATCAAVTGVAGILFAIRLWWLNRGRGAFTNWVHETSGAATVASEVSHLRTDLTAQLEEHNNRLLRTNELQDQRHQENLGVQGQQSQEIGALSANLERTTSALNRFTEEHIAEADQRNEAIAAVARLANATAVTLEQHLRSRRHLPRNRATP